jgi:hypothetical protein
MPNIERPSDEISIDTPTDADSLMIKPAELGSVQEDFRQYTIEACAKILFREPSCVTTDWAELKALINYLSEHPEHTSYAIVLQPPPSGNEHFDTLLAGVAEKLADDAGISRPEWCALVKSGIARWPQAWTTNNMASAKRYTPPQLRIRHCIVDKNVLWEYAKGCIPETSVASLYNSSEDTNIYTNTQPVKWASVMWGDPEMYTIAACSKALLTERWGIAIDWTQLRMFIDFLYMFPEHLPYAIACKPHASGDEHLDALLVAMAEKLADDAGIARPKWCLSVAPLGQTWYPSGTPRMIEVAIKTTPQQFMARNIIMGENTLWRTRIAGFKQIGSSI